ncbi:MAG: tetratricopeptide repeat protein [Muribaculaceae bacterium]|nr:tetratricopeptide repeat protein [Muribaculaceae bacterium]
MKLIKSLLAAAITFIPVAVNAADLLPAMTSAADGGSVVNSPAASGYAERGRLMIADGNYRGAADQLREGLALDPVTDSPMHEAARYWLAVACAHIPGQDAPGLFSEFLEDYPASQYRERALLGLAGALCDRNDYAAALAVYESVNPAALSTPDAAMLSLGKGYCLLKFARYTEAAALYRPLLTTANADQARFYLAYIDYVEGRYREALDGFLKVNVTDTDPVCTTPYYLAQTYYMLGDYHKAADTAKRAISSNPPAEYLPELQRVCGEALYELGDRPAAMTYLRQYYSSVETPQPSACYLLGVDAYDNGNYESALKLLTPAVTGNSAMAQSATLYMGLSYMQLGDYDAALLMLDRAVKNSYSDTATQLASYNYAVATARGGKLPFGSSVTLFENFLRTYPDSDLAPAVADYIINGYITDNNYAAAMRAIEGIRNPSDKILAAKQKVAYIYGTRLLQSGRPDDAITNLTEARRLGRYSGELASESTLWLGEAYYRKGDYDQAVRNYDIFLRETPSSNSNRSLALYDLGYAHFARKDFARARDNFNSYLKSLGKGKTPADVTALKADAYNRLGDCAYYTSDFTGAAALYDKAVEAAPDAADYPMFQTAVMRGLTRDHKGKIDGLADMMRRFPSSALIPSALLETGESYSELGDNTKAIATYAELSRRFPSTAQGRQGALLLAIARLNSGDTDAAITAYKHVISTYPTSDEARAAADDLKHIYADRGQLGEYTRYIASIPDAPKLERGELAMLQLEAVEKANEAGRENDALRLAQELVDTYPDSPQAVSALAIIAPIKEKQDKPAEALAAYTLLESKASNEIDINNARMGILRLNRDLGNDAEVLEGADRLLGSSSLGSDDRNEVMLIKALAMLNAGDNAGADPILSSLAENPSTLIGAKAAYYLAQSYFDRGKRDAALVRVNALIDSNTPQEYWLARGFILLSDIKRAAGNSFEADEYLRSLRDNYPGEEPDIFRMIGTRLAE